MDRLPLRRPESAVIQRGLRRFQRSAPPSRRDPRLLSPTQVVFQEERASQGGGQSQGCDRGGVQETGAHKVRPRACWCRTRTCQNRARNSTATACVSALRRAPSPSFSFSSPSCFLQEIQSSSPAGLCCSEKGENPARLLQCLTRTTRRCPICVMDLLLRVGRYVSDAVTGVIISSILFFFPSQKPSLSWWFDSRGQREGLMRRGRV